MVLAATWIGARVVRRLAARGPENLRRQLIYGLPKIVWAFGILILLSSVGINVNSLLAVLGIVGIAGALVFTPVGQNVIAGFLAGMDDVVQSGDVISVDGKVGRITRKGTLSLSVEFPDGSMVYMPNTKVVDDELTNHNRIEGARIDVEVKLDGSPDKRAAVRIMEDTLEGLEWRRKDKPTMVHFIEVGSNAFHYRCFAWIDGRLDEPIRKSMMLTSLVYALEDAGISVGETTNFSAANIADSANEVETSAPDPDRIDLR